MPFTPPSTYTSKANTGFAGVVEIGDASSPPIYTAILEVKSFNHDHMSMPDVIKTHLLSPGEEFAPGIPKPGKLGVSGNFIGDATQLNIITQATAQNTVLVRAIWNGQQGAKTVTLNGSGYFSSLKVGPVENNKTVDFNAEVQWSGLPTFTVA